MEGRYILLDLTLQEKRFTLLCLYGPNNDDPLFFSNIHEELNNFENESIVVVGDWNVVRNPGVDTYGYRNIVNPGAKDIIDSMCEELNLNDMWKYPR